MIVFNMLSNPWLSVIKEKKIGRKYLKNSFHKQTLPATKKDVDELKKEMNEIKLMFKNINWVKNKPDISLF